MMNPEKYRDPTAEQAIYNVMKKHKPLRYLPDDLYHAVKAVEYLFGRIGYDVTEMRFTDRETGRKYIRGGE